MAINGGCQQDTLLLTTSIYCHSGFWVNTPLLKSIASNGMGKTLCLGKTSIPKSIPGIVLSSMERTIPGIDLGIEVLPKHNVFPIPLEAIDLSNGVLTQNPEWQ